MSVDPDIREVVEGTQVQGEDEEVIYSVDTSNWGGTPTSPSVKVYDADGTDVTGDKMPTNSPSVATDTITLSPLKLLTAGVQYRVEVKFTSSGNVLECYFYVNAIE